MNNKKDIVDDLFSMISAVAKGSPPQLARDFVKGLVISTVLTPDAGWETAIGDSGSYYPVERYKNEHAARVGHARWVVKCKKGLKSIIRLGIGKTIKDCAVKLKPRKE